MNLPDGLMEQVKARAAASGRTATSVVEEALRLLLAQEEQHVTYRPMPTYGTPGTNGMLIDILDKDALWAALDGPA